MDFIKPFLLATSSAYLSAYVLCMLNKTSLAKPAVVSHRTFRILQAIFFILMAIVNGLAATITFPKLAYQFLGLLYGFACVASFIGVSKWMAYWKKDPWMGSDAGQIGMALWDLVLSVVYFYLGYSP